LRAIRAEPFVAAANASETFGIVGASSFPPRHNMGSPSSVQARAATALILLKNRLKAISRQGTRSGIVCRILCICLAGVIPYQVIILAQVIRLRRRNPDVTAFINLRRQEVVSQGKIFHPEMIWVPYDAIPPQLLSTIINEEDPRFWRHPGFDPKAIWRATKVDLKAGRLLQGGSTIDQQLAKNLFLSPAKNPLRKIQEIIVALEMETFLSKRRIMEIYLNIVEWGDGIYGVEAASQHYFGKSVNLLDADQAAYLTAIIPGPRGQFNPVEYPERVATRAKEIYESLWHDDH
jgi:monofunctional biosynthetic peptidoglycan transglycosylase